MRKPARIQLPHSARAASHLYEPDRLPAWLQPHPNAVHTLLSLSRRGGEMSSAELARKFATSPQTYERNDRDVGAEASYCSFRRGKKPSNLADQSYPARSAITKRHAIERSTAWKNSSFLRSRQPRSFSFHSLRTVLIKFTNSPGGVRTVAGSRNRMVSAGATRPN